MFYGKAPGKINFFHFLKHQNGVKAENQTLDFEPYFSLYLLFKRFLEMWRMALYIRHNCGERKNTVGHR